MVNSGTFDTNAIGQGDRNDKACTTQSDGSFAAKSDEETSTSPPKSLAAEEVEGTASDEDKGTLCCSVPLDKVQGVLTPFSPPTVEDQKPTRKILDLKRKDVVRTTLLCLYCERSFASSNLRQKHVERIHSVKKNRRLNSRKQNQMTVTPCFYCNKFDNTENTLKDLFQHLVDEHSGKYFGCVPCEQRFSTGSLLADHNTSKHPVARDLPEKESREEAVTAEDAEEITVKLTRSKTKPKTDTPVDDHHPPDRSKNKNKNAKLKELRSKKLTVKSSRIALNRRESKRLQAINDAQKKKQQQQRHKPSERGAGKATVSKPDPAPERSGCVNPYPEFDHFYRVKKITDHSIDNLKISSLTFDDVFDKTFFNRIKCNIEENLLHHIDGKLFKNEESESRISNFEKISTVQQEVQNSTVENFGCDLTLNAVTPVASLSLNSQYGEDFESQIEYGAKPSKKKTQTKKDVVHYKYFTRRKFQASILEQTENRDLSKLDMWTQLVIKKRQQKIIDDKKTPKEIQEYTACDEYKNKIRREELNRILDRRGPFEDLREEASKKAALDKLNSDSEGSISQESFTEVREVLNEILNRVFEITDNHDERNDEQSMARSNSSIADSKQPDLREIPSFLNLRRSSSLPNDGEIDQSDKITLICSSQETENFELPTNPAREKDELIELSGEWARCRMYICAACGAKLPNMRYLLDHKTIYHQNVWVQHYEFVGNQSELYRHLSIPALGKVGYVENSVQCKSWKRSDARTCTKCKKQCNTLGELHRHILECGGDWTWMLARKKCKYRYGGKSRRKRRGLVVRVDHHKRKTDSTEKKKYKYDGPRQRPSDAETIQRMLANLPAKRSTRKLISLYDGVRRRQKNQELEQKKQKKVKCGKVIYSKSSNIKETTEKTINTQKSTQSSNLRSMRSLNRVLSSKILDTTATLSVKRKLKVLNDRRRTRQSVVAENMKLKDSEQPSTSPQTRKKTEIENAKLMRKLGVKKLLTGNINIKSFFPVKKRKTKTDAKPEDIQTRSKTKPEEDAKKDKKKLSKKASQEVAQKQNDSDLKRKKNLKQSFRSVINRVKRLKIDNAPEKVQTDAVITTAKSPFLDDPKQEKDPVKIVIPSTIEAKENLADISEAVRTVITAFNGTDEDSPVPENIFKLDSDNEKSLQAKGEPNFDTQQHKTTEPETLKPISIETSVKPKTLPMISPNLKGKIRKPARGLNDCIAMLTSKLQQKTETTKIADPMQLKPECILKIPTFKTQNDPCEEVALDLSCKSNNSTSNEPSWQSNKLTSVEKIIENVVNNKLQEPEKLQFPSPYMFNSIDLTIQNVIDGHIKQQTRNTVDDIIDYVATLQTEKTAKKTGLKSKKKLLIETNLDQLLETKEISKEQPEEEPFILENKTVTSDLLEAAKNEETSNSKQNLRNFRKQNKNSKLPIPLESMETDCDKVTVDTVNAAEAVEPKNKTETTKNSEVETKPNAEAEDGDIEAQIEITVIGKLTVDEKEETAPVEEFKVSANGFNKKRFKQKAATVAQHKEEIVKVQPQPKKRGRKPKKLKQIIEDVPQTETKELEETDANKTSKRFNKKLRNETADEIIDEEETDKTTSNKLDKAVIIEDVAADIIDEEDAGIKKTSKRFNKKLKKETVDEAEKFTDEIVEKEETDKKTSNILDKAVIIEDVAAYNINEEDTGIKKTGKRFNKKLKKETVDEAEKFTDEIVEKYATDNKKTGKRLQNVTGGIEEAPAAIIEENDKKVDKANVDEEFTNKTVDEKETGSKKTRKKLDKRLGSETVDKVGVPEEFTDEIFDEEEADINKTSKKRLKDEIMDKTSVDEDFIEETDTNKTSKKLSTETVDKVSIKEFTDEINEEDGNDNKKTSNNLNKSLTNKIIDKASTVEEFTDEIIEEDGNDIKKTGNKLNNDVVEEFIDEVIEEEGNDNKKTSKKLNKIDTAEQATVREDFSEDIIDEEDTNCKKLNKKLNNEMVAKDCVSEDNTGEIIEEEPTKRSVSPRKSKTKEIEEDSLKIKETEDTRPFEESDKVPARLTRSKSSTVLEEIEATVDEINDDFNVVKKPASKRGRKKAGVETVIESQPEPVLDTLTPPNDAADTRIDDLSRPDEPKIKKRGRKPKAQLNNVAVVQMLPQSGDLKVKLKKKRGRRPKNATSNDDSTTLNINRDGSVEMKKTVMEGVEDFPTPEQSEDDSLKELFTTFKFRKNSGCDTFSQQLDNGTYLKTLSVTLEHLSPEKITSDVQFTLESFRTEETAPVNIKKQIKTSTKDVGVDEEQETVINDVKDTLEEYEASKKLKSPDKLLEVSHLVEEMLSEKAEVSNIDFDASKLINSTETDSSTVLELGNINYVQVIDGIRTTRSKSKPDFELDGLKAPPFWSKTPKNEATSDHVTKTNSLDSFDADSTFKRKSGSTPTRKIGRPKRKTEYPSSIRRTRSSTNISTSSTDSKLNDSLDAEVCNILSQTQFNVPKSNGAKSRSSSLRNIFDSPSMTESSEAESTTPDQKVKTERKAKNLNSFTSEEFLDKLEADFVKPAEKSVEVVEDSSKGANNEEVLQLDDSFSSSDTSEPSDVKLLEEKIRNAIRQSLLSINSSGSTTGDDEQESKVDFEDSGTNSSKLEEENLSKDVTVTNDNDVTPVGASGRSLRRKSAVNYDETKETVEETDVSLLGVNNNKEFKELPGSGILGIEALINDNKPDDKVIEENHQKPKENYILKENLSKNTLLAANKTRTKLRAKKGRRKILKNKNPAVIEDKIECSDNVSITMECVEDKSIAPPLVESLEKEPPIKIIINKQKTRRKSKNIKKVGEKGHNDLFEDFSLVIKKKRIITFSPPDTFSKEDSYQMEAPPNDKVPLELMDSVQEMDMELDEIPIETSIIETPKLDLTLRSFEAEDSIKVENFTVEKKNNENIEDFKLPLLKICTKVNKNDEDTSEEALSQDEDFHTNKDFLKPLVVMRKTKKSKKKIKTLSEDLEEEESNLQEKQSEGRFLEENLEETLDTNDKTEDTDFQLKKKVTKKKIRTKTAPVEPTTVSIEETDAAKGDNVEEPVGEVAKAFKTHPQPCYMKFDDVTKEEIDKIYAFSDTEDLDLELPRRLSRKNDKPKEPTKRKQKKVKQIEEVKEIEEISEDVGRKSMRTAKVKALEHIHDEALSELTDPPVDKISIKDPKITETAVKKGRSKKRSIQEFETPLLEDLVAELNGFEELDNSIERELRAEEDSIVEPVKEDHSQSIEEGSLSVEEPRRSRRGSRKVASYNENDLIDPLIDAIENKRKGRKKEEKISSDVKQKKADRKLNSDELFDLLKASTNDNAFVPKPPNSFLSSLEDTSGDVNEENFDNMFENMLEKSALLTRSTKEIDRFVDSTDNTEDNTERSKIFPNQDSNSESKTKSDTLESNYCDICSKSFVKLENLIKHRRTLTHIQKLSELEAREAEKSKIISRHEDENSRESVIEPPSLIQSTENKETLQLADIITDVLGKPIENEPNNQFSDLILQDTTKRYKSLGERKSFDSDTLNSSPSFESKTQILEKQISLLENIIENQTGTNYVDDISLCSEKSDLPSPKPRPDHNGFLKPFQYEEISEDSVNVRHYDDPKLRKTLNRDEELFLECCSLLKSGSEVSGGYSNKKIPEPRFGALGLKPLDQPGWMEKKNFTRDEGFDCIDDYSDNSRIPTPLGNSYDDDASDSNTISSSWGMDQSSEEVRLTFENISKEQMGLRAEDAGFDGALTGSSSAEQAYANSPKAAATDDFSDGSTNDNRKMMTKGARKVFEGLKVSIPTEELNLEEVLNYSPKQKKLDNLIEEEEEEKQLMSPTQKSRNSRKSKPVKKSQVGSNLLFKVNKKKLPSPNSVSCSKELQKDVYDFEETQDNTEAFAKPDFKAFRNLKNIENDDAEQPDSNDTKKPPKAQENITKKKCMIMGRIFKNAAKSKVEDIDEEIRTIPVMNNEELVENYVRNHIIEDVSDQQDQEKQLGKSKKQENRKKIKIKGKKRTRTTSDSTDDEFSINKTAKRRSNKKNPKEEDNVINLEQELKECIGVASRKSQRKCTSGKQNVLVEYWSSDESQFEALLEKQIIEVKPKEKPVAEPPPTLEQPEETIPEVDTTKKPVEVKKVKKKSSTEKKKPKNLETTADVAAVNRRKRAAVNPLYHWSSSSEDEAGDLIEIKPLRDEIEDDEDRPVQHGWIVGDSPKKLVTMLAQAKGKKSDVDCVKEQGKKRTNTVS